MEAIISAVVSVVVAVLASSGLWAFLQNKRDKHDGKTQLLIGLAHDRIIHLGMNYVERGYVTQEEYSNLRDYLYKPYEKLGGNGSAKRVMQEVDVLPIYRPIYLVKEEEKNDDKQQDVRHS